jgi:hypothetical protein
MVRSMGWVAIAAVAFAGAADAQKRAPLKPAAPAPAPLQAASGPTPVCALVYHDLNGNGARDGGEPPMPGITIHIGTPSGMAQVSDSAGRACFPNFAPVGFGGAPTSSSISYYDFYESVPGGWISTDPGGANPHKSVSFPSLQPPPSVLFGLHRNV